MMLSKATGFWRPNVQVQAFSPGFETNDTGFMQRTDIISAHAIDAVRQSESDGALPREEHAWFGVWQNRNFDGNTIERGAFIDSSATLLNYWNAHGSRCS